MKRCVLIGGMGSGKSTVSRMLQEHGAKSVDLDDCGHETLLKPEVIDMLTEVFGEDVLDAHGEIDHKALAAKAFQTTADTIKLNRITQPRLLKVAEDHLHELEEQGADVALVEISAFDGPAGTFAPLYNGNDGVICVTAPTRLRIKRAMQKGFSEEDAKKRIARQVTDEQRALWSDYIISNKGTLEDLQKQVDDVWAKITA